VEAPLVEQNPAKPATDADKDIMLVHTPQQLQNDPAGSLLTIVAVVFVNVLVVAHDPKCPAQVRCLSAFAVLSQRL